MGITSDIIRTISHALRGILGKGITVNPWDLINPEKEFKKVQYEQSGDGWDVYYNDKPVGGINPSEMKVLKSKEKPKAYNFIMYKLEAMHSNFKNKKLNGMLTKDFMNKIGYWKDS